MNILLDGINYVIDLGVSVMMPIIITILGLVFRQKFGISFRAGLMVGVGFIGINLVINLLLDSISPVTNAMVERFGFTLTATDIGWGSGAAVAWGTEVVPFVFLAIIITNIIMILFNWTKTLDIDIWNFWQPLFISAALYITTGSMILAVLSAIINMAIIFKLADWTQKEVEEVLGLEGVSLPQIQTTSWAVVGYPMNGLINKIPGVRKINWTTERIQERAGVLGEPVVMGLIIGLALGIAAGFPLDQILQTGITVGAALVILPRVVALLMEGLGVISDGAQEFLQKRFPNRELYIGLDSAVGIGHPFVISLGLIMIPITLALAFILPGNKVLPLADLSALPFYMIFAILPARGNLFRGLIIGTIIVTIILYLSSFSAPLMTELGRNFGYDIPEGSTEITNLAIGAQWYTWVVYWVLEQLGNLFSI